MRSLRLPFLVVLLTTLFAAHARALVFEENRGQAPPNIRFLAHRGVTSIAVEDGAFSVVVSGSDWLRLSFAGASPCASTHATRRLSGRANYFLGNDPARWITDVPLWEGVAIRGIYPGIDVRFREARGGLEYDFVVAPGADPDVIAMRAEGSLRLVEHEGALIASHDGIEAFRQLAPLAFQGASIVDSAIRIDEDAIRFAHASVDPRLELVIDPVIVFSTYLGGSSGDQAHAITVDAAGNTYIAGATYSSNYPLRNPFQPTNKSTPSERDAFVTKLDASGQVVFSTYFGGTRGRDLAEAIAVDASGAVYFTGTTYSLDLPVSSNAFQKTANPWVGDDGFLAKLVPAGNALAYATYLAAVSNVPSTEFIRTLLVDGNGNAIVAGDTSNATWPVTPGAYRTTGCGGFNDGFVTKMNATGTALVSSTYVCGSGTDWVNDIDIDAAGNLYIVLQTTSADLPRLGARQTELRGPNDTWVAKLNPNLSSLLLSAFVGGTGSDIGTSIAVGADGFVYIGGKTSSNDFPTLNGVQMAYAGSPNVCFDGTCGDGFLARLRSDFGLASATYLGGSNDDDVASLALSPNGVVAVGTTVSTSFPLVSPLQSSFRGKRDAFVATLGPDLRTLTFSTFLGGAEWDIGLGANVDAEGGIYVTGYTGSTDFPLSNAWQAAEAGDFDAFVVKLGGPAPPVRHRRAVRH